MRSQSNLLRFQKEKNGGLENRMKIPMKKGD